MEGYDLDWDYCLVHVPWSWRLRPAPLPQSLVNQTLTEAAIGARTGLSVIGVQEDGRMVTPVPPDLRLRHQTALVALGSTEQRDRFAKEFE